MTSDVVQFEAYRPALLGHCYRMLGSAFDADDAVQETIIRAWRAYDRFDGRASLKSWLYRIATNVCLDELKSRGRRARPMDEGRPASGAPPLEALTQQPGTYWIEPILDAEISGTDTGPEEKASLRQSIRLAFIAALQTLPPKQRAALLMAEVLDCPVAEIAETLETSIASVNSALQRARSSLAKRNAEEPAGLTSSQQAMLERYVTAFESYDVSGLVALMQQEVTFCMPPYSLWLQGPQEIQRWMLGLGSGCRGSRLVSTFASGWPAFAQYRPHPDGGHEAWALIVLELSSEKVVGVNNFLDVAKLFPRSAFPCSSLQNKKEKNGGPMSLRRPRSHWTRRRTRSMDATAQLMSTESTNHQTEPQATAGEQLQSCRIPSGQILTGRILSGLVIAFLFLDGVMKLVKPAPVVQTMLQLGYPESATLGIGILLLLCTFLYLVPRTALVGAILLTGYLGGAVATNVRVGAPLFNIFFPVLLGCIVWGGLTLRDRRLRSALA